MDITLAQSILTQAGSAALYLYLAQAKCAGLEHPRPYPAVARIVPGEGFRCGGTSPTGWCAGLHSSRTITLSYGTTDAWPHELFHAVLCQLPGSVNPYRCDPQHRSPLWQRCLLPAEGP
jgi:hypothetical protein